MANSPISTLILLLLIFVLASCEDLVYGIFPQSCLSPFSNMLRADCLKKTIAKFVGYGIVIASSVVKLPQVVNIIRARSTEGVSDVVLHVESIGYLTSFFYPLHYSMPFSAYGESLFLSVQSAFLMLLLWHYNRARYNARRVAISAIVYATFFFTLMQGSLISDFMWSILYAVLPQISTFSCNDRT